MGATRVNKTLRMVLLYLSCVIALSEADATANPLPTLSKQNVATDPIVWTADTMSFVAPTPTEELALVSRCEHKRPVSRGP